jgi:hypothetical protein
MRKSMAIETVLQGMVLLSQVTVVEKGRGMQDSTRESLGPRCNRIVTVDLLRLVSQFDIRGCCGHSWLGLACIAENIS